MPPAVEAQSLNHWTAREVPKAMWKGWANLNWVFCSGFQKGTIKVPVFPSEAWGPLRRSCGCWQSQFLVAVGLRFLLSCWWTAGASKRLPTVPDTWPLPGLSEPGSSLLQGQEENLLLWSAKTESQILQTNQESDSSSPSSCAIG